MDNTIRSQAMPKQLVLEAKRFARELRRFVRLSPMQSVLRQLRGWGFRLEGADALECFAATGQMHTIDYCRKVETLTLWEIRPECEEMLKASFPRATIRIADSYEQVTREPGRFDLLIIDNTPIQGRHVDSFDLFPHIFKLAKERAVFVLTVIPRLHANLLRMYPGAGSDVSRDARRRFYFTDHPESVSVGQMVTAYERLAETSGFRIQRHCVRRRNRKFLYLVLDLIRSTESASQPGPV